MTSSASEMRCRRTTAIVDAILDGRDHDRIHVATCPTCMAASERAHRFTRKLAAAALDAGSGVPDPAIAAGTRRMGTRAGRLSLGLITLGGAVAAGLLLAAALSLRGQPLDPGPPAFGSVATAEARLAFLDMSCAEGGPGIVCASTAEDHVHRVAIATDDEGRITGIDAVVESIDGKALVKSGADVLFGRIARSVLSPQAGEAATDWIRDSLASCGASCSADLAEVTIRLENTPQSSGLTLREP